MMWCSSRALCFETAGRKPGLVHAAVHNAAGHLLWHAAWPPIVTHDDASMAALGQLQLQWLSP